MNCPNCNSPINDGDIFCLNCGQKIMPNNDPAPAAESDFTSDFQSTVNSTAYNDPASYGPAPTADVAEDQEKKASPLEAVSGILKNDKVKKILPIAAVAVVAVVVIVLIASLTGGAKSVAKKWLKADQEGNLYSVISNEVLDHDDLKKLIKEAAKEEGYSEKELYEEVCTKINEDLDEDDTAADFKNYKGFVKYLSDAEEADEKEDLEETYGSDYKIKIKLEKPEKCTKSQSEEYRDSLDYMIRGIESSTDAKLNFDSDDAKKFVKIEYTVTIEGSEDSYEDDGELVLVKIKGDWKVMDSSFGDLMDIASVG